MKDVEEEPLCMKPFGAFRCIKCCEVIYRLLTYSSPGIYATFVTSILYHNVVITESAGV